MQQGRFKSGKNWEVSNYRPVSILPIPRKILKKIIHGDISIFLENDNVLCDKQGGFRKNHSTFFFIFFYYKTSSQVHCSSSGRKINKRVVIGQWQFDEKTE